MTSVHFEVEPVKAVVEEVLDDKEHVVCRRSINHASSKVGALLLFSLREERQQPRSATRVGMRVAQGWAVLPSVPMVVTVVRV